APVAALGYSVLSPDRSRRLKHDFQLAPLIILGEEVSGQAGGKAALRTDCDLIERDEAPRLIDSSREVAGRFQVGELRADQTENDRRAFGNEAQRFEATGAIRIILQQDALMAQTGQEPLRNRIIVAL